MNCKNSIIGGGVVGLSVAMNLAIANGKGNDICLFESKYLGYGSSLRNAGRFRVHFGDENNLEFAIESSKYLNSLSKITGMNVLFAKTGYLWIASDEASYNILKNANSTFKKWGVPLTEIPSEELYKKYKFLRKRNEIISGFLGKEDGTIHPDSVIFGMARKCKSLKVNIFEHSNVEDISIRSGKVESIKVNGSKVETERVIIANGAWMTFFSEKLGLNLPIEPVRKEISVTEPFAYRIEPFIVDSSLHTYVSQTLKGEIIGSTSTGAEPKGLVELGNSFLWLKKYAERLSRILAGAERIRIIRAWSGYYEMTPDRSHVVGRSNDWPEELYVIGGFSGHGFMLGPLAGKLMAEYIFTGTMPRLLRPYSPERFKTGKLINETFVIG
ncbi:MAG: FAD-binding oxidoreductase [Fervidicoccus fontis]|uniref:FAD-binding oxidoreductase n=1 Tax=Fervidicoccus fontis TaxID=683846 RepID=A0A2J6N3J2_9CREN|nr:MAG: FAD-binding oxidoreductase [Fervidicoccus fontis]PMB77391.1 MAG: FAD-binding oxidoreductase [Fervidicoccus fontis]